MVNQTPSKSRLCGALTLAAVLLCCSPAPAAAVNYNNLCALVPTNTMVASSDACDVYYQCNYGVATQMTCGEGMSFSVQQQTCLPSTQVNCFANGSANPCDGRTLGSWAPMANSCQGFYYCSAEGPQAGSCPGNLNFDPSQQKCDYIKCSNTDGLNDPNGSGESSTIEINLCNFVPPNMYFGSASQCAGYSICSSTGSLTTGMCSSGYLFNTNIQMCDYSSNVNCIQVTNDPELTGTAPAVGASCTTSGLKSAVNFTCNAYYECDGSNMVMNYCAAGLYYDTVSQLCVPRMQARNICDRCQGTTLTFVNAPSTSNCTGYYYCQNGVETSAGVCPAGQFFDEEIGSCTTQIQTFACCNPSASSTTAGPTTAGTGTTVAGGSSDTTVAGAATTTVAGAATTTVAGAATTTVAGAATTTVAGAATTTVAPATTTVPPTTA